MRETSSSPPGSASVDGVIDQLLFLAHFFGKRADPMQLLADTPVVDGRIGEAQIVECAQRGGLSLSRAKRALAGFKRLVNRLSRRSATSSSSVMRSSRRSTSA